MTQLTQRSESDRRHHTEPKTPRNFRDLAVKPRIKIFLSADIVGSTAFKQGFRLDSKKPLIIESSIKERKEWQDTIVGFYDFLKDQFPFIWTRTTSDLCGDDCSAPMHRLLAGEAPHFWKTVGDEVLFWKEVGHEAQLWIVLSAWLEAIALLRPKLRPKGLDVKCCIWLAEFPIRNCALPTTNDQRGTARKAMIAGVPDPTGLLGEEPVPEPGDEITNNAELLGRYYDNPYRNSGDADFIGPGIDIGFRIASFASQRRMAVSVDFLYLLTLSRINIFGTTNDSDKVEPTANGRTRKRARSVADNLASLKEAVLTLKIPDEIAPSTRNGNYSALLKDIFIHFSGTEPLKGVLGGINYPKFWVSIVERDSYEDIKQRMYLPDGRPEGSDNPMRQGPTWGQIYAFCDAFYNDRNNYVRAPTILVDQTIGEMACRDWSSSCDDESYKLYMQTYSIAFARAHTDQQDS